MPFMLWAAIIVEYGIQSYVDGSLLLAIQLANATIGWHEATKAQDAGKRRSMRMQLSW